MIYIRNVLREKIIFTPLYMHNSKYKGINIIFIYAHTICVRVRVLLLKKNLIHKWFTCTLLSLHSLSLLFFVFFFVFWMRTSCKKERRIRLSFPLSFPFRYLLYKCKGYKKTWKTVCIYVLKEKKCQQDCVRLVLSQRNVCRVFMWIREDLLQICCISYLCILN